MARRLQGIFHVGGLACLKVGGRWLSLNIVRGLCPQHGGTASGMGLGFRVSSMFQSFRNIILEAVAAGIFAPLKVPKLVCFPVSRTYILYGGAAWLASTMSRPPVPELLVGKVLLQRCSGCSLGSRSCHWLFFCAGDKGIVKKITPVLGVSISG